MPATSSPASRKSRPRHHQVTSDGPERVITVAASCKRGLHSDERGSGAVTRVLQMYLAGDWTTGTGDRHHALVSPVTGEHIADVPLASPADIDRAVAAARAAQEEFRFW